MFCVVFSSRYCVYLSIGDIELTSAEVCSKGKAIERKNHKCQNTQGPHQASID